MERNSNIKGKDRNKKRERDEKLPSGPALCSLAHLQATPSSTSRIVGKGRRVRERLLLLRAFKAFFVPSSTPRNKHDTTSSNLSTIHRYTLLLRAL